MFSRNPYELVTQIPVLQLRKLLSEVSIQKVILYRHQRGDNLVHCLPPILMKGDCNGVYVCIGILVYVVTTSSKSLNQVGVYLKAFPSFTYHKKVSSFSL